MKYRRAEAYKSNLEKYKEDKRKGMKKERGIALVNVIIIILLILILFTMMALLVSDNNKKDNGQNNPNENQIANNGVNENTNQTGNNDLKAPTENNTNDILSGNNNMNDILSGNNNTSDNSTGNNNTNNNSTGNTIVNNCKIGDTINLEADNMLIRIDSIDVIKDNDGTEIARAQVTFKNTSEVDFGKLTTLYYMINPVSTEGIAEIPYHLILSDTYKDNLLRQNVKSGETIKAYLYWFNSSYVDKLKISPIVDVIDAEQKDFVYGDPYYIEIKGEN